MRSRNNSVLILSVFFALVLLSSGCSKQHEPAEAVKPQSRAQAEQSRKLFENLCAGCHGKDARGGVGPDLTATSFKYGKNRADIMKTITNGRSGGMPAFESYLKPEEIAALADYILLLQ